MRTTSRHGSGYGEHVASCAHLVGGFSAAHNPGMHQGATGWDDRTCH